MDRKYYEQHTEKFFTGRKVKSIKALRNGVYRFPAGITWTIERKQGGFELLSDPCPHCGIRAWITKVSPGDVEFIDPDDPDQINGLTTELGG